MLAALPNSDAVFLVWAGDRSSYLAKTSMLRRRLLRILKPRQRTRAVAESARSFHARGILAHQFTLRVDAAALRAGAAAFSGRLLAAGEAADAGVREADPLQRVSANAGDHAAGRRARDLLWPFPRAGGGGAIRESVPGLFSDPALSGKLGAESAASRLHLRRDEYVPASVPAGGDAAKNIGAKSHRVEEFLSGDGAALLASVGRRARPAEPGDEFRRSRAAAQAAGAHPGGAGAARRSGVRRRPAVWRRRRAGDRGR